MYIHAHIICVAFRAGEPVPITIVRAGLSRKTNLL